MGKSTNQYWDKGNVPHTRLAQRY